MTSTNDDSKRRTSESTSDAASTAPTAATSVSVGKQYDVKGKTALITGAGSGINFCFAKLLVSKGCNVMIADLALRPESQALVDEYNGKDESKPRASFVKTDVTVWSELNAMFKACYSEFGALDVVCPGAGIFEPGWSNFWHPPGSPESGDPVDGNGYKLLDVNVVHPIRTTQLAIAEFLNPLQGLKVSPANVKQIVHISSMAGQTFGLPAPLYIASKHAINGFVRCMGGLEKPLGIKVTGVAPGVVKTPLFLENPDKLKSVDQERDIWVTPEEVAEGMLRCMESEELPGGTILEIGAGVTRKVEAFNDPGPLERPGMTSSNMQVKIDEVFEWLAKEGWGKTGI
ncbi:NAD-dependent 15-hydroxyprostaglandin dehydrogenase [Mycena albidolilacea]|uniref:NAD-dependent 15-hydroxyprostaglandin dehydrogenase n=1 Tax=Mycena albidolilacea TaxID=1033008 RepID=A0AAD6ZNH3_9AGAR|nr:NAD-dependent 15-hydroxyprostaglandin dehydrogenase [Mycena albidolilacea]